MGVESQHCAERRVAIEISLNVKFQQFGVDGAADDKNFIYWKSSHASALDGGSAGVHDQRADRFARPTQQFECDDAVLAPSDGDEVEVGGMRYEVRGFLWFRVFGSDLRLHTSNLHKGLGRLADAVGVEELAEAVPVEFAPEGDLIVGQAAAVDSNSGRAGAFPVAYQFNHADIEHQEIEVACREVEERAALDEGCGVELHWAHAEVEAQVQAVGFHVPVVVLIVEKRVLCPQLIVFVHHDDQAIITVCGGGSR